jgi:hypothetical protein
MPLQPIKQPEISQILGRSDEFLQINPETIQRILSRSSNKLPIALVGKVLDGLEAINSPDFPAEIRAVLTGIITDGVLGGLDAAVFNNILSLPLEVIDFAKDSFESVTGTASEAKDIIGRALEVNSLEEIVDLAGDSISFVNGAITDTSALLQTFGNFKGRASGLSEGVVGQASGIISGVSQLGSDPLGAASNIISGVSSITGLTLPGSNIIKTASNIMGSIPSIAGGLKDFSVQGLGLKAASLVLGTTPAGIALNLAAPLLGGLFGGLGNKCPCHSSCRKTDHFIAEDGTNLLETCAPLIMSSPSALESVGNLLSNFI